MLRVVLTGVSQGLPAPEVYGIGAGILLVAVFLAVLVGRRSGRRAISQRLTALGSRLGLEAPDEDASLENALTYLEQVTGAATEAVADSSAEAIRLRRSLDTFPQGVVLCDENGTVVYRNARANALMTSRHGDALAAQAVTELLEDAWDSGDAERTLDLYGPPRRTLNVRARLIDDGRRALGVIAIIEDVSERRRLEEIRRDFVANVSHELKTPMGALGLLAETLVAEPDVEVARRLASRIHTEAFRVSRIIDDLLDLSRIESEQAPPREPVLVNLVMAEAVERVRATAEQRGITITLDEPDPPVVVLGDRRQLVSAMHALIENAVTFSYDGSVVAVSANVATASLEPPGGSWSTAVGLTRPTPVAVSSGAVASAVIAAPGLAAPGYQSSSFTGGATDGELVAGPAGRSRGTGGEQPENGRDEAADHTPPAGTRPHGGQDGGTIAPRLGGGGADALGAEPQTASPLSPVSPAARGGGSPAGGSPAGGSPAGGSPAGGSPAGGSTGEGTVIADATPANGEGHAGRPREMVRISVVDHGVGIPARDLDRIFERFYRVDHGRSRETGGTGLGLSIVRHVATNHLGWVEVESREGEGSTFTLVLPTQSDRSA